MLMLPRPKLSGRTIGLLIGICFLVSALVLPIAAHLPPWIEFELVLGIWWVVWWIVLCFMLLNRYEVEHDAPVPEVNHLGKLPFRAAVEGLIHSMGCVFDGGCLIPLGIAVALGILVAGVLFVVELLVPGIAFLLCVAVRGMLLQAVRRHSVCEGNAALSAFWAMVWATVYTGRSLSSSGGFRLLSVAARIRIV